MMIQITDASATCRSRSISGRASTTIVVSTAVISTPVITTTMPRPACTAGPPGPPGACTAALPCLTMGRSSLPGTRPWRVPGQSGWPKPVTARARKTTAKAQVMPMHAAFDRVAPNRVTVLENFSAAAGGMCWAAKTRLRSGATA
jgi:hypothetical protein